MRWFNCDILNEEDIREILSDAEEKYARFKPGDSVKLWMLDFTDDAPKISIDCRILNVKTDCRRRVKYDIISPIGETGLYHVLRDIFGGLTPPHFKTWNEGSSEPATRRHKTRYIYERERAGKPPKPKP